jgi:hypothetical protein
MSVSKRLELSATGGAGIIPILTGRRIKYTLFLEQALERDGALMDPGLRLLFGITLFTLLPVLAVSEVARFMDTRLARQLSLYLTIPMVSLLVIFIAIILVNIYTILT